MIQQYRVYGFFLLTFAAILSAAQPLEAQVDAKSVTITGNPAKELEQAVERPASVAAASLEEAIDRAINNERMLIRRLRDKQPVIETYIQELKSDPELGYVPYKDSYFLGKLNMADGIVNESFLPGQSKLKYVPHLFVSLFTTQYNSRGFSDELFIDVGDFDRSHYAFEFVRREFLGDVRCLMVNVKPRPEAAKRRFEGRMWIEDRDYHVVRFQGSYLPNTDHEYTHFDSWRINTGGTWLPAFIYSEEEAYRTTLIKTPAMRAQTRLWGYERAREKADEAFTNMTVDVPQGMKDESEAAAEYSPLQSYRMWEHEAQQNVLERLERAGMIAPQGEVDQVLNTVLNNLQVNSNLNLGFPVSARVLLTTPLESVAVNHAVLVSRGLIDVLPDEESLAAVMAHELAHVALGHSVNTKFAFEDRLLFDDPAVVKRLPLSRTRNEEAAADAKAIEILKKSPYKDGLPKVGLFLRMLSERSVDVPHLIRPLIGNQMSDTKKDLRMSGLMDQAPQLQIRDKDQVSALPLGSRIKMDPWSNQLRLMKTLNVERLTARDKMPFQITPIMLHLTREDAKTAGLNPPLPQPQAEPTAASTTNGTPNGTSNSPRP